MNGAQMHLIVNHVPVIGFPFALVLLALALARKSDELALVGYWSLVVLAVSTYMAVDTGGDAAHLVHALSGVNAAAIRPHAHAAHMAFYGGAVLAALALVGLFALRRSRAWLALCAAGTLALSVDLAYVAHLGGLIRHPEIASGFVAPAPAQNAVPARKNKLAEDK
ncbi:MAG: hypothetical protein KGL04_07700 [Elusimicrobia bacterium]|nr:hypothetical protein [Elusimicrobiota bacterium]MDE2314042.1 hypothetical protein [Elusimicrobiota bacterium]